MPYKDKQKQREAMRRISISWRQRREERLKETKQRLEDWYMQLGQYIASLRLGGSKPELPRELKEEFEQILRVTFPRKA
jgi:hypothetical protein